MGAVLTTGSMGADSACRRGITSRIGVGMRLTVRSTAFLGVGLDGVGAFSTSFFGSTFGFSGCFLGSGLGFSTGLGLSTGSGFACTLVILGGVGLTGVIGLIGSKGGGAGLGGAVSTTGSGMGLNWLRLNLIALGVGGGLGKDVTNNGTSASATPTCSKADRLKPVK